MEIKDLTAILVVAMVGCVLVAGFIPVVGESVSATDTLENTGYYHMEKYDADTDLTISWDHTKPKVITVNDDEIPITGTPVNQWVSIVVGDTWALRYANGGTLFFTTLNYGSMQSIGANTQNNKDLTIVCENGTATATPYTSGTPETSVTVSYSEIYVIANDGNYVMKKSNESVYMGGNTPIVAFGTTPLDSSYSCMVSIRGTIADGVTPTIIASTSGEAELVTDSVTVNTTALTSYVGYSLDSIQFDISDRGTDYPATYSYFIVPATVTLEKAIHADAGTASMIAMIPFILIMGIVLMFVGVVLVRRYV